ncbi:hypothetical protein F4808DRAFT_421550 [Astrocystis sublimbata]|nr:hypothetical protein F4808DRAFT_421550 [Astrocystis sublimbata]
MSKPDTNNTKKYDLIRRGEKKPSLSGTLTFVGLRLADIPLQAALLSPSTSSPGVRLLSAVGLRTIYDSPALTGLSSSASSLTNYLSSPSTLSSSLIAPWSGTWPPTSLILLSMSLGSALKQIYWQTITSQESFPPAAATAVSFYNTFVNSANTLLFLALGTTSLLSYPAISFPSPFTAAPWGGYFGPAFTTLPLSTIVGSVLYLVGLGIETIAETQRARFKGKRENRGMLCKEGLWGWSRHVNYFGYALWRGAYCMVASGWVGGVLMGVIQAWDLGTRAVAVQDEYCGRRYGVQWEGYKREVRWKVVPGVW